MSTRATPPSPNCEAPVTIRALVRKRAEIAGQIKATEVELRKMLAAMDHIDFAIHIFDAAYATDTIRAIPPLRYAFRGQSQKILLDTLREASGRVSTEELGLRLLVDRGLTADDPDIRRMFTRRANASLQHMRRNGVVRNFKRPPGDRSVDWELVRDA